MRYDLGGDVDIRSHMNAEATHETRSIVVGSERGNGRLPDFIIIGGMKCGSTTLYQYLCRHPDIFMCAAKEPMFFSREPIWQKGQTWYRSLFAEAASGAICGEASTCYTRWPQYQNVPQRIHDLIPDAKLIYIMRHPVERMYSHYLHVAREQYAIQGKPFDQSFEQAIESSSEYLLSSMYIRQIEQYLSFFPRSSFHFLTLDELTADPRKALQLVEQFLNIRPLDLVGDSQISANTGEGSQYIRKRVERVMIAWRQRWPLALLVNALPKKWRSAGRVALRQQLAESFIGGHLVKESKKNVRPMLSATRVKLLAELEKPTRELEAFLERDVPPSWFV